MCSFWSHNLGDNTNEGRAEEHGDESKTGLGDGLVEHGSVGLGRSASGRG